MLRFQKLPKASCVSRFMLFPRCVFPEVALQRLQAAFVCWSEAETSSPKESRRDGDLAAQSCEGLVRALRLLKSSVPRCKSTWTYLHHPEMYRKKRWKTVVLSVTFVPSHVWGDFEKSVN